MHRPVSSLPIDFAIPALNHVVRDLARSDGERIRGQVIPVLEEQADRRIELLLCGVGFRNHVIAI
jgi:hypothetical protein